jgi:PKD repeat protein
MQRLSGVWARAIRAARSARTPFRPAPRTAQRDRGMNLSSAWARRISYRPRRRGRRLAALLALLGLTASADLAFGVTGAHALITTPLVVVGPVPPPIPGLPAATEAAPPAGAIGDRVEPAAVCGGWSRQDLYGGAWAASSTWWEYRCSYASPQCSVACDADWSPSIWTDYFYWDGSKPVFYGEFYGDYYYGSNCDYWWDQPTAGWYVFDTAGCPFSGPGNAAPSAAFSVSCSGLNCSFDGSGSWASDGIVGYRWDFGDGTSGSGITASHSYPAKGSYRVTLTVTDAGGLSGASAQTVATTDIAPTARFTVSCTGLTCGFDGGASSDPDGMIRQYSWSFGDGYGALGSSTAQNTYAQAGSYMVRLDVTDDAGLDAISEQTVSVVGASSNVAPTASFAYTCAGLTCRFDGSGSTDPDGTIVDYEWSFGDTDNAEASTSTTDHTYLQAGSYRVTLTVIDDGKASATTNPQTATVTNVAPAASFTVSCSALSCGFDGSASADSDGTINSYWWNFGDGSPLGVGSTPTHSYPQNGSYNVTLTVIDNGGLNATATQTVTVAPNTPPAAAFTVSCSALSCRFDGGASSDSDGTIIGYSWNFGDGSSGSGKTTAHTYPGAGGYTVTLAVTDNGGATTSGPNPVTVISLSARGYKQNGLEKVDLFWNAPGGGSFDVYRNGPRIATVQASAYTDTIGNKGSASYTYKVCAAAFPSCSNQVTVSF